MSLSCNELSCACYLTRILFVTCRAILVVVKLGVGSKIAFAPALRNGAFLVSREPLPCVVEMQDMLTLETKRREPGG